MLQRYPPSAEAVPPFVQVAVRVAQRDRIGFACPITRLDNITGRSMNGSRVR
jgi:hypothetical protein